MNSNNLTTSKEPWLAVVLSTFLAGIGQIYSGKILRGCVLIFIQLALAHSILWLVFSLNGNIKTGMILLLLFVAFFIWNLFDAYKCAKSVNTKDSETSRKQNKDPWLAVFLSDLIPGLGQLYTKKWFLGTLFIICTILSVVLKENVPVLFFGLWAVFSSLVCYHAYISSPVRREPSKKLIAVIALVLFGWELLDYSAIPIKKNFVDAFKITPSGMEPTFVSGDRVLVKKSKKYKPKRGDIVVFKSPDDSSISYIKRIVALGGESVEIRDHNIYINGKKTDCLPLQKIDYVAKPNSAAEEKTFMVPDNSLFVLGDKSNSSFDSRFYGPIPKSDLIGKVYKIYWPPKRMGIVE